MWMAHIDTSDACVPDALDPHEDDGGTVPDS